MSDQLYRQYEDTLRELAAVTAERDELKRVDDVTMTAFGKLEDTCKQLHAINTALTAERDALKDQIKLAQQWRTGYEQCKAERDALKADAARYRWLRGRSDVTQLEYNSWYWCFDIEANETDSLPEQLDAAIDAAMSGGKK